MTKNLTAFAKNQEPKHEFFQLNDVIELVINLLKKDLEGIITYYMFKHKKIHLLVHVSDISFNEDGSCLTTVYAAMAGRAGPIQELLDSLQTDVYKFNFLLQKDGGDWLLHSSDWERATTDDISMIISSLKEN